MAKILRQSNENKTWFLAFDEGDQFLGAAITISEGDTLVLDGISVLPEHRSKGVGGALISEVKKQYLEGKYAKTDGLFKPDEGCDDKLLKFYEQNGVAIDERHMRDRL